LGRVRSEERASDASFSELALVSCSSQEHPCSRLSSW
jgi:hypothetical protein